MILYFWYYTALSNMEGEYLEDSKEAQCEYCGCDGKHTVSDLIATINRYQQENIVMFSKIMEKLDRKSNVADSDMQLDDPDFSN